MPRGHRSERDYSPEYRDLGSIKRRAAVEGGVHQSRGAGPVPDAEIVGEFMAEEFCTKRARGKE